MDTVMRLILLLRLHFTSLSEKTETNRSKLKPSLLNMLIIDKKKKKRRKNKEKSKKEILTLGKMSQNHDNIKESIKTMKLI